MAATVRKHTRVKPGKRKQPPAPRGLKRFTLVFPYDIDPIRSPGKSVGAMTFPFVLRILGTSFAQVMGRVNVAFNQPHILAAFDGWPEVHRGDVIYSYEDVAKRFNPEAAHATE